jgi:very-short-patch-repair endonuclease
VYALGHDALSQEGRWLAAVLAAGEGSALSHLAAATLLQAWRRRLPRAIYVVSPHSRRPEGVRVHRCRRLDPRDVTVFRGIPVTTIARTLVDLTDELTAEQLANVIHEAAFRNRFDIGATRAAMERASGRRRLAVLENALALHASGSAGTRSDAEDAFLSMIREAAAPEPRPNERVENLEVDFHWPEHRLVVEIDGPGHRRPRTALDDQKRDQLLREAGWTVLRLEP